MRKLISVVIPAFNEEKNLPIIATSIKNVFKNTNYNYEIIFVDDGSIDNTPSVIKQLASENFNTKYILFSRNFGHQIALKAGFEYAKGNAIITMDCDLQHPPALITEFLSHWEQGFDIVYSIRKDAKEISWAKKTSSNLFYNFLNKLSNIELETGTADFRLMDEKVIAVAKNLNEQDLFWRGLVKWMGFSQIGLEYLAGNRLHGKSTYTFKKMMQFALKGITSFSTKPLNIAIYLGFTFSLLSLLYVPYVIVSVVNNWAISGWASIIVTIAFFGGLQLMILGIIGLYLGKLFMQSKQRPHFIIKETNIN